MFGFQTGLTKLYHHICLNLLVCDHKELKLVFNLTAISDESIRARRSWFPSSSSRCCTISQSFSNCPHNKLLSEQTPQFAPETWYRYFLFNLKKLLILRRIKLFYFFISFSFSNETLDANGWKSRGCGTRPGG
jgi:hypothetical protein